MLLAISIIFYFWLLWVFYLAIMSLKSNRAEVENIFAKGMGWSVVVVGFVMDVAFNLFLGTIIFLQLPREHTFTARLERNIKSGKGWRHTVSVWLCSNLLDPFDKNDKHCKG